MKNKVIYFLLILIAIEGLFFAFRPNLGSIRTDSGWDSDYGGGSDWGGSDWDSGSSYSSDSGSGGSGKSLSEYTTTEIIYTELLLSIMITIFLIAGLGKEKIGLSLSISVIRIGVMLFLEYFVSKYFILITYIVFYPALFICILNVSNKKKKNNNNNNIVKDTSKYQDISEDKLKELGIDDINKLKTHLFQVFIDVQNAWMEFDYDALAKLCSDELYNSYKSDLETLMLKNGKNIMESFMLQKISIINGQIIDDKIKLDVFLNVKFIDYVINTKTNEVIRGTKTKIHDNCYLLKYSKNNKVLDKCPSCGANIENKSSQVCKYCNNIIVNNNDDYILVSKGRV